jgi:IclR family transcriptional regulator, acetate operon repressor
MNGLLDQGDDNGGLVKSLARAFSILDTLSAADGPLSLKAVSDAVGLPRSTCHRLLTTMQSLNYVRFEAGSREWMVGRRALSIGSAFARTRDIASIGRPIMRTLSLEINETINLSRLTDGQMLYVEQITAKNAMPTFARPGVVLAPNTTASGKVILAHMEAPARSRLLDGTGLAAKTCNSVTDPARLLEDLEQTRLRGYAIDDQENCVGIRCLAVPVFDEKGAPCGALSVSGGVSRITPTRIDELARALAARARSITTEIGGIPALA